MLEGLCGPNVITIEGDMLPAERIDMGKQIVADNLTVGAQFGNSAPEINGVPEDDIRDREIEARNPVLQIFEGAVTDFAETVENRRAVGIDAAACGLTQTECAGATLREIGRLERTLFILD